MLGTVILVKGYRVSIPVTPTPVLAPCSSNCERQFPKCQNSCLLCRREKKTKSKKSPANAREKPPPCSRTLALPLLALDFPHMTLLGFELGHEVRLQVILIDLEGLVAGNVTNVVLGSHFDE